MKKIYKHLITYISLLLWVGNVYGSEKKLLNTELVRLAKYSFSNIKEVIDLVEEYNFSIEGTNEKGQNLLHIACSYRNFELIKWLIDKNQVFKKHTFAVDALSCSSNSFLYNTNKRLGYLEFVISGCSSIWGDAKEEYILNILKYLVGKGVRPNKLVPKNNQNILHYACNQGYFKILKWLIDERKVFKNNIFRKDDIAEYEYFGFCRKV